MNNIPLELLYATSLDDTHPPSNAIDESETTFWTSTGLFPQQLALKFPTPTKIVRITTVTGKVKSITMFAATDPNLTEWVEIDSYNLPENPIKQSETHQLSLNNETYGLKIVVNQAWGPFVALYSVKVQGTPVHTE